MELLVDRKKIEEFCCENKIDYLGLFGSVSRKEATETSDVDLLVRFSSQNIGLFEHLKMSDRLENLLGRKVDLVTERSLHPYIREKVLSEVITLYERR